MVVSHDKSMAVPFAAFNFVGRFVGLIPFGVENPNEVEVDEFVHCELEDSASVVSSYIRGLDHDVFCSRTVDSV